MTNALRHLRPLRAGAGVVTLVGVRRALPLAALTRAVALVVALIMLAPRVATPAGYMIGRDTNNLVAVMLCAAGGPVGALLDLDTGAVTPDPDGAPAPSHDETPCPFSLAAHLAPAPLSPLAQIPLLSSLAAPEPAPAAGVHLAHVTQTPPARGPPAGA